MMSTLCVIPEPKHVFFREGFFTLTANTGVRIAPQSPSLENTLKEGLSGFGIRKISTATLRRFGPFKVVIFEPSNRSCELESFCRTLDQTTIEPEGYILDSNTDRVILLAKDDAGLFYACQTLFQIIRTVGKKNGIPAVRIEDVPQMRVRGAQIEPFFLTPTIESIEAQLRTFARYKLNTVLFCYTNKFKFDRHPLASHPDAYTKDQLKKLDALAQSLHINLVPVLQCFGHAENVLKNPEYAHLREGPDIHTQFCPEHPGSFQVFKEMAEEMMAVHSSPYFHIGADETYFLGHCPKCRKIVEKEGEIGLFLKYVNRVCDFIVSKGKIPVLWDDMFCKSPGKIKKLHPKATICYWDYFPADANNPFVFFRNEGYFCDEAFWKNRKWWGGDFTKSGRCHDLSELDAERLKHYTPYFSETGNFNYLRPFPFHKFYQDAGYPTIGCAAVRGGEYSYICPNYTRRLSNILSMIQVVAKNAGQGVIATTWSEIASPEELTMYPLVATAEFSWSGNHIRPETFDRKFIREFFGCDDPRLIAALHAIGTREIPLSFNSEQRADLCAKGGVNPIDVTYAMLFDKRIADLLASPDLPNIAAELETIKTDVESTLDFLLASKRSIRRNKHIYDHLILAARTVIHKIDQFFLVRAVEKSLEPRASLKKQCIKLLADMRRLKSDHERLFSKTYLQTSIRDRSAMMFEGEMEKINQYINR